MVCLILSGTVGLCFAVIRCTAAVKGRQVPQRHAMVILWMYMLLGIEGGKWRLVAARSGGDRKRLQGSWTSLSGRCLAHRSRIVDARSLPISPALILSSRQHLAGSNTDYFQPSSSTNSPYPRSPLMQSHNSSTTCP